MAFEFREAFHALTGNAPFPWQESLYQRFIGDKPGGIPSSCNLPTGLGKTSVVAVWLIALAQHPDRVPRRLVYVVNRRTVVDQTTIEVEKYRKALRTEEPGLQVIRDQLADLCATPINDNDGKPLKDKDGNPVSPLALSTLRGQFADNREWSADPSRPAVIVGTVDMIGSRLLFSGYGVGFKGKPLHAGFLGQDVLLVHDEAHLEPAFQELLEAIKKEQNQSAEFRKFHVLELSATSRGLKDNFTLTAEDLAHEIVKKRIGATKAIHLMQGADDKKLADEIAELALIFKDSQGAILVFVRTVDDVMKVRDKLAKQTLAVATLTGTMRGLERDALAEKSSVFQRFLPNGNRKPEVTPIAGTAYLVCTSAGEVGVNISADYLVCDLSTFESMAQRFGRVNRFGELNNTQIHVVYPTVFDPASDYDSRRQLTLDLLNQLNGDGSPQALAKLDIEKRVAAFAPAPKVLEASDILFDAWALSTIQGKLPGRPAVEPYLHGIEENPTAETLFAWREEVSLLAGTFGSDDVQELLEHARLKPHELLRVTTFGKGRAYDQLQKIADRTAAEKLPVWIIEPDGSLITDKTISDLVEKRGAEYTILLASRTVVLPPRAGGLSANGTLDGAEGFVAGRKYDVAGLAQDSPLLRFKVIRDAEGESWLEPITSMTDFIDEFKVELAARTNRYRELNAELRQLNMLPVRPKYGLTWPEPGENDDGERSGIQEYLILQSIQPKIGSDQLPAWPQLNNHLDGVRGAARAICERLKLDEHLTCAIELSGAWHDLGKTRAVWQRGAGNEKTNVPVAKTIHGRAPENLNRYRHELGSLIDVCGTAELAKEFESLTENQRDIVLHLIAVHHGRGRPHFPDVEAHDIESPATMVELVVKEVPARFARLQRKYGRWGLAYLESILRAADILDSQRIESTPLGAPEPGEWSMPLPKVLRFPPMSNPMPSIRINVDRANPGQFFACCGLLELADRIWPGVESWFEEEKFCLACDGTMNQLLDALADCHMTNTMSEAQHARFKEITAMSVKERKAISGVEDESKTLDKLLRESSIEFGLPFSITLDWFADDFAGGSRFKTWAGRQSVLDIATSMKDVLKGAEWRNEECLTYSAHECGLPFNFDSDLGAQGGAIDVGFSFDPLAGSALTRIESVARPALELLAFVGLQRFRPDEIKGGRFLYVAWNRPLPIEVASPAVCGALPIVGASRYEFRLLYRTKYLKSFLPAIPFSGGSNE